MLFSPLGLGHISEQRLRNKYLNKQSKFKLVEGLSVHYRVEGDPQHPAVFCLHGLLSSLHTWDGWVEGLKKHYCVYTVDLPGFGFSSLNGNTTLYDLDNAMMFLDAFITAINIDRCHIVGNSLGGYLAWNYALRYPEKVLSLAVIDPVSYHQKLPWQIRLGSHPLINPWVNILAPKFIFEQSVKEVYGSPERIDPKVVQRYFELTMRSDNKKSMAYIFRVFRKEARRHDLGDKIQQITSPTYVVWGAKDRWVPPVFAHVWKCDVKHAQLAIYDELGHVPMEESPHTTLPGYLEFLSTLE